MEALVMQAFARKGHQLIADEIGASEATVSRLKNEHLANFIKALAAAGLKVVPDHMRCYPDDQIEAIFRLAQAHMRQMESSRQLAWEDGL
jgi:DNA-binding LacI/PurR family transcriptional regulator